MGKKIALLIGVSEYKNAQSLPACEKDVELISKVISGTEKFDDILVINDSPKSVDAKGKISSFIKRHKEDDIEECFLFYSGHGARHNDDFIYLFSDYNKAKTQQTSLSNSELDSMIRSLNPDLAVKVVDACQSGSEYIKSPDELKIILNKSSEDSFNNAYFFFSSSKEEYSIALSDYSVFTKSFAKSLLGFEEKDIRYRDVMDYIADDESVKLHQTPFFISQGNNTDLFCSVSKELAESILLLTKDQSDLNRDHSNGTQDNITPSAALSREQRIISAIKEKSKDFCNEEEAQKSLAHFVNYCKAYKWSELITELFEVECVLNDSCYLNTKKLASWIKEDDEPYFAEMVYTEESYEAKQRVEIEEPENPFSSISHIFGNSKRVEYKPVTKYRDVISGFTLTAPSPERYIQFTFKPKEEALSWFQVFVTYVFSKSKLTIFYKFEKLEDVNWANRNLNEKQQWKIVHCKLKSHQEIKRLVDASMNEMSESITETFMSGVMFEEK